MVCDSAFTPAVAKRMAMAAVTRVEDIVDLETGRQWKGEEVPRPRTACDAERGGRRRGQGKCWRERWLPQKWRATIAPVCTLGIVQLSFRPAASRSGPLWALAHPFLRAPPSPNPRISDAQCVVCSARRVKSDEQRRCSTESNARDPRCTRQAHARRTTHTQQMDQQYDKSYYSTSIRMHLAINV